MIVGYTSHPISQYIKILY